MIKRVFFDETIMVPVANLNTGDAFIWVGTLRSEISKCNVLIFDTESKNEIKALLESQLAELKKAPDKYADQIKYIEYKLMQLKNPVWLKVPLSSLLVATEKLVNRFLDFNKIGINIRIEADNVLFISGISDIG